MVFVDALRFIHTAIQVWGVVLCEADNGLNVHEDVEQQSEPCVGGCKVFVSRARFVYLDNHEARSQGCSAKDVEQEMCERAGALLFRRVCGLQDEGCLDGEEEAGL